MDFIFHGASASVLAYGLGEKSPRQLIYAALIGISPDTLWVISMINKDFHFLYSFQHSLLINILFCLTICCFNWKIAFGGILHITFDVFTHNSSTMHLLYPFSKIHLPIGVSWWEWPGLFLWLVCWILLAVCFVIIKKKYQASNSCITKF